MKFPDSALASLEFEVVQAAITRRETERRLFPVGAPLSGDGLLNQQFVDEQQACDALIEARKQLEIQVLYQEKK